MGLLWIWVTYIQHLPAKFSVQTTCYYARLSSVEEKNLISEFQCAVVFYSMAAKTVVKTFNFLTFCEFLSFTLLLLCLPAETKGVIGLSLLEVQVGS